MKDIFEEPAYSNSVIDMLKVAHEYCLFIENAESVKNIELLTFVQRVMPLLYLKGSLLPEIDEEISDISERFVTEEKWEEIFNMLRNKLLEFDEFWVLQYDGPDQTNPLKVSLSENLTDIYQDLKDFVLLYQKPMRSSKQNAAKDCKYLFETHWGTKTLFINQWVHYLYCKNLKNDNYSNLF